MKVYVPMPLRSYTGTQAVIEASGETLEKMLADIDRRHPGFRLRIIDEQNRIREHIKIFVNQEQSRDLSTPLCSHDALYIICALSGGVYSLR
jgi:molybdopterin synthase sulfur carrier subunit